MPVTDVRRDTDALALTIECEYDAPVERVWQLWADPRQLERWWGPPTHPATFVEHDLSPGGKVTYFMTGPEGERYHGYWQVERVEPLRRLEVLDLFADDAGEPDHDMPTTTMRVLLDDRDGGTRMIIESTFSSAEAMEQILAMGAEEGMKEALGQIEAILAETPRT
jgi:uncharacterized protein YndB with AHSA1/START domain